MESLKDAAADPAPAPRRRLSAEEHRRLARRYRNRQTLRAYAFLAPNLFFFLLFLVVPCGWLLWTTFHTGGVYTSPEFVGLDNWQQAFADPLVSTTVKNSFMLALMTIPLLLALGLALALLLRNIGRGGPALRAALYVPTLTPLVIVGSIWLFLVHPDFGALNLGLRAVGADPVNWVGDTDVAMPTIAMVEIWRGMGFWALFFLAALVGLPGELYQAAHLDGAGAWQRFRYLTVPLLRPTFLFAFVVAMFYSLQIFDTVFIMTDGGPANSTATVSWYIYKSIYVYDQAGFGATLSFVLLLMILAMTLLAFRVLRPRRGR